MTKEAEVNQNRNHSVAIKLKALLASWVTIVFTTSTFLYLFSVVPIKNYYSNQVSNTLKNIWEIADEISPAVKLSIVIIFGSFIFLFDKIINKKSLRLYLMSVLLAFASILLVLLLMPTAYSRGYGIGLTGKRFDLNVLASYLLGSFLGGIAFAYVYLRLMNLDNKKGLNEKV